MQSIRSGQKIRAIKQLREETGMGLKEAKAIVDQESEAYRQANPRNPVVEEPSRGPLVAIVIIIAVAVFWYLSKGSS